MISVPERSEVWRDDHVISHAHAHQSRTLLGVRLVDIIPNYRIRLLAAVAGAMILFVGIRLESAPKLGRLLSREEVPTTWIGFSEDELYMFRITLEKSGRGKVAYGFLEERPTVLMVTSWS